LMKSRRTWDQQKAKAHTLELAFFTFELVDFPFQLGDALQGIAMATIPVSGLLAEFEVLTLETLADGRVPARNLSGAGIGAAVTQELERPR
jgi:hypothetical protein